MMAVPKRILIVDDETINLDFFELMLTKLGFIVEKAGNGMDALEKLQATFPDLILLDNIMPKMSGWELIKILKSDSKLKEIPIIMLSALDDVKDKVEGFELGVDDYITKPFNFTEVLARIRSVLRNHELFSRIAARESSLAFVEQMSTGIKDALEDYVSEINELDAAVAKAGGDPAIMEKAKKIRKKTVELEAMIGKTLSEWNSLKETGMSDPDMEDDDGVFGEETIKLE